jgi:dCMP deaminase
MSRPTWDQVWMSVAQTIAKRSVDPKYKMGAVIVSKDNTQVFAVGYNGDHAGGPNQRESLETGGSGFLHAEINALIKCDYHATQPKIMYITSSPCRMCCKAIINAGIAEVVYGELYPHDISGLGLMRSSGITVRKFASPVDN